MRTLWLAILASFSLAATAHAGGLADQFGKTKVNTWKGWVAGATNSNPGKVQISSLGATTLGKTPATKVAFSVTQGATQFSGTAVVTARATAMRNFVMTAKSPSGSTTVVRSVQRLSERNYDHGK